MNQPGNKHVQINRRWNMLVISMGTGLLLLTLLVSAPKGLFWIFFVQILGLLVLGPTPYREWVSQVSRYDSTGFFWIPF